MLYKVILCDGVFYFLYDIDIQSNFMWGIFLFFYMTLTFKVILCEGVFYFLYDIDIQSNFIWGSIYFFIWHWHSKSFSMAKVVFNESGLNICSFCLLGVGVGGSRGWKGWGGGTQTSPTPTLSLPWILSVDWVSKLVFFMPSQPVWLHQGDQFR